MRVRVFGQHVQLTIAMVAGAEAILFLASFFGAALLYYGGDVAAALAYAGPMWVRPLFFAAVLSLSLVAFGLYSSRQRARAWGVALRVIAAVTAGLIAMSSFFYLIPIMRIGQGVLGMATCVVLIGLAISRAAFSHLVDESIFKRRVLVYGCGRNAVAISNLRRRTDRRGFTLAGFVQPEGEAALVSADVLRAPSSGFAELCERLNVAEVVVAMEDRRRGFPILELLECRLAGIEVTELLSFLERETGRVRIDFMNPSWMIFSDGFRRDTVRRSTARILDLAASSVIVLLTLPVMVLAALAIKLEDGLRAPVFYAQPRVGLGGRTFNVLKFRSMRTDAERDGKAQWATKGDMRVTRVGAFIRKCRIDELPQILCVFRGHMSFVGPRPERPAFVTELSQKIPYYVQRHCVKPGITGWAQLCYPYGSSEQDALEKLQYDLYYIKNNTLLFDLAILVQTVEVVFMGQGAR